MQVKRDDARNDNRDVGGCCAVEIKLSDLFKPALQLLQIDIVFFQFRIGEMLSRRLLGDPGFKVGTFVQKLAILLIAIGLEAGDGFCGMAGREAANRDTWIATMAGAGSANRAPANLTWEAGALRRRYPLATAATWPANSGLSISARQRAKRPSA